MAHTSKTIKGATILLYVTVALAGLNSWWFDRITTDHAHKAFSNYFFIETIILILVVILSFSLKWTRFLVGILTIVEAVLFFQDRPISPDELLMIIIFGIRVYILNVLFGVTANQFYKRKETNALDNKLFL